MDNTTDEASKVLRAVCALNSFPWEHVNTTNTNATKEIKDAVVNNLCTWVMILTHFVNHELIFLLLF